MPAFGALAIRVVGATAKSTNAVYPARNLSFGSIQGIIHILGLAGGSYPGRWRWAIQPQNRAAWDLRHQFGISLRSRADQIGSAAERTVKHLPASKHCRK